MVRTARRAFGHMLAAFARVMFIFISLIIADDALTRMYYAYMPIETWMDFKSVTVEEKNGQAVVVIKRDAKEKAISLLHRTLVIKVPEEKRDCTNMTVAVINDLQVDTITVPLATMLAPTCPMTFGDRPVRAILQVSYIFEFPYGVKRFAVRYSNEFTLVYRDGYKLL